MIIHTCNCEKKPHGSAAETHPESLEAARLHHKTQWPRLECCRCHGTHEWKNNYWICPPFHVEHGVNCRWQAHIPDVDYKHGRERMWPLLVDGFLVCGMCHNLLTAEEAIDALMSAVTMHRIPMPENGACIGPPPTDEQHVLEWVEVLTDGK